MKTYIINEETAQVSGSLPFGACNGATVIPKSWDVNPPFSCTSGAPPPSPEDPEDPVIEDPVIEDPVIEDPVVDDPVVDDCIIGCEVDFMNCNNDEELFCEDNNDACHVECDDLHDEGEIDEYEFEECELDCRASFEECLEEGFVGCDDGFLECEMECE